MTTTSSIILVHRILISLNNLTVRVVKTSCHFYEMYVILNVCKFHIHKFIMSKYSISVESFSSASQNVPFKSVDRNTYCFKFCKYDYPNCLS